jgi:Tfp pilus assembly protein FimT
MKKLGIMALMLGMALAPGVESSAKSTEKKENAKQLISRLQAIKGEAAKGQLSVERKAELKKEVKSIKKDLKQQDPVLVISLSAALLVALILVLLAD